MKLAERCATLVVQTAILVGAIYLLTEQIGWRAGFGLGLLALFLKGTSK